MMEPVGPLSSSISVACCWWLSVWHCFSRTPCRTRNRRTPTTIAFRYSVQSVANKQKRKNWT